MTERDVVMAVDRCRHVTRMRHIGACRNQSLQTCATESNISGPAQDVAVGIVPAA